MSTDHPITVEQPSHTIKKLWGYHDILKIILIFRNIRELLWKFAPGSGKSGKLSHLSNDVFTVGKLVLHLISS